MQIYQLKKFRDAKKKFTDERKPKHLLNNRKIINKFKSYN